MCDNINNLFEDSSSYEDIRLDIEEPKHKMVKPFLPDDFLIRTICDIKTLQEFVALKYTNGLILYRGHESRDYKIESTIVRLLNQKGTNCTVQNLLDAEKKSFDLFCYDVFKEEWLHNKLENSDEDLFKMSIGRHLGLPCRLIDVTASLENAIWFAVMNPKYYNKDGEVILIVLNKEDVLGTDHSPFSTTKKVSYANEPFIIDSSLSDLPLGEQRRFIQYGRFIWVDDNSLLNEEHVIADNAVHVAHFTIPWYAKQALAIELYRDVYSGCAYQAQIEKIKNMLKNN